MSGRDPIADEILTLLADGAARTPQALEQAIGVARAKPGKEKEAVARYRVAVRQQLRYLARRGAVDYIRKGARVDPDAAKGVVRVRLADGGRDE